MCNQRSINSINLLGEVEEATVLHLIRCNVIMVVTSFSMIAKAVKMLNAQVKALKQTNKKSIYTIYESDNRKLLLHYSLEDATVFKSSHTSPERSSELLSMRSQTNISPLDSFKPNFKCI